MKKRFLCLFLAILMVCTLVPFSAFAASPTSGKCGDKATWTLKDGVLTISGTGDMASAYDCDSMWIDSCEKIKTVIINDGITSIGAEAFFDCQNMTSIKIPDSVMSIGECAFGNCAGLTSIKIPDSVISIGEDAFSNCTGLTNITIPKNVTRISEGMLAGCSKLTSVTIPNSVRYIDYGAFSECKSLKKITIPDGVQIIGLYAFQYCSGLESITIPNSVTNIDAWAFIYCSSLKSITIPDSVDSIPGYAFFRCTGLTSVTIPYSVKSVDYQAFYGCNALKDVYYGGTKAQWNELLKAVDNSEDGNYPLLNATVHYSNPGAKTNIYNLGEETYSFKNYGDFDSRGGHCFGMSMTSAGYYLGLLDSTNVGAVNGNIYKLSKKKNVKKPICYYQKIQGSKSNRAVVAGGSYYLYNKYDISSDWESVINYVKNHKYDDKGMLQIGFRKDGVGGHAIDFLRYKVVDGQERIYAYDNNFPTIETYFYKGSDGKIYQAPKSTFDSAIDCIALRDVRDYFSIVGNYFDTNNTNKKTSVWNYIKHVIFAEKGTVSVKDATRYPIEVDTEGTEYVVFELPESIDKATITPLEDNATFIYLDEEYSFGNADGKKGVLKLSDSVDNNNATWKISSDKNSKNPFSDVSKSAYCYKPVMWAYSHDPQITSGVDKTHFAPNNECTRAQIVTFLWRANGCPEVKGIKNPFKDVSKDAFYYKAVLWAVSEGITSGVDKTHFAPNASCTRGQAVTFLWRADGQPNALITKCPFKDASKGAYYYDAMLWAVGRNITNGVDKTHFAPNNTCTRGQIVTFLYRDMA